MRGPYPQIRMIPSGGVSLETASAFLEAGAFALGVGGKLAEPRRSAIAIWPTSNDRPASSSPPWPTPGRSWVCDSPLRCHLAIALKTLADHFHRLLDRAGLTGEGQA